MNYRNPFKKTYRGIVRFPSMAGTFFGLATVALVSLGETAQANTEKRATAHLAANATSPEKPK